MSNPLSLLPFAMAAGGGRIDDAPAAALVAAGFALLQRSAPIVRALAGRRSGILLPSSGAYLTALAASDGRGAVLLNPSAERDELSFQLDDADVGVVFTSRALSGRIQSTDRPIVLLDDAPRRATVIVDGKETHIDLGSHFGLELAGEVDVGRDEDCVIAYTAASTGTPLGAALTHRNLLANARGAVDALSLHAGDHLLALFPFADLFGFTVAMAAPTLAGARVSTASGEHPSTTLDRIAGGDVSILVGDPATYAALIAGLEQRAAPWVAPALRVCVCGGAQLPVAIQDRWFELTGSELRQGYSLAEAAPLCLFNPPHFPNRRGTLGIPFPGVEVTIRDPDSGVAQPQGTEGALCVRGPNVFRGYLRGGERGRQLRDGWLYTGDRGCERSDGTFELRGHAGESD
ncbi:MAG: AMP-binding protein [Gemmatimonadetes bacterium]|nr:AMP-binding protein [Gemmatimonadota bacterium]